MENKTNSAIEKTEKIAEENKRTPRDTTKKDVKKSATNSTKKSRTTGTNHSEKSRKTSVKTKNNVSERRKIAMQKREEMKQKRLDRKVELAKIRAEKAESRRKASLAREQARLRKVQALKEKRLERKAEAQRRRDALRNETNEQRRERISQERQEKLRLRSEKAELRAKLISEKRENRKQLKMQKRNQKHERKKYHTSGIGGWLAAVISLGVSVLILGSILTYLFFLNAGNEQTVANANSKSYYDLKGYVDNIDVNLSKLLVSSTETKQQKLLNELAVESNLAENELQQLPIEDENKYYTSKFINQLGDISVSLSNKLIDGGSLTATDKELLSQLFERNAALQNSLMKAQENMQANYDFNKLFSDKDSVLLAEFNQLENLSIDYPQMIYDGPFSDGAQLKEAKGLTEKEITEKQAETAFNRYFKDYDLKEIKVTSEAKGVSFEVYNVEAKNKDDVEVYAQIAKKGGKLIMFAMSDICEEQKFTAEECEEIAANFIKSTGIDNMTAVWKNETENVMQFNFALKQEGIIIYPDLIKVNVCMEKGIVTGYEAKSYYLNHVDRNIDKATITEKQALSSVSGDLAVETKRLVVIPVGESYEKLAYEFSGEINGSVYYVYIDAKTGQEAEIFKVVKTGQGTLLI